MSTVHTFAITAGATSDVRLEDPGDGKYYLVPDRYHFKFTIGDGDLHDIFVTDKSKITEYGVVAYINTVAAGLSVLMTMSDKPLPADRLLEGLKAAMDRVAKLMEQPDTTMQVVFSGSLKGEAGPQAN